MRHLERLCRDCLIIGVALLCIMVASSGAQTCGGDSRGVEAPVTIPEPGSCLAGVSSVSNNIVSENGDPTLKCGLNNIWEVDKRIVSPTISENDIISGAYCALGDEPLSLTYEMLIDNREELAYYGISGRLNLTLDNAGDCNATLVSVVLLFERAALPAAGKESFGSDYDSHILLASVGVENAASSNCPDTNTNTHETNVCFGSCGFEITYTHDQLYDVATNSPLSLSDSQVPAGGSLDLQLAFEFKLNTAAIVDALTHTSGDFRVNILVTYDTCCPTENACDIDYDCDGQSNSIYTAQVRTAQLAWPGFCEEICGCLTAAEQNATTVGLPNGDCFQFSSMSSELTTPSLLCGDLISYLILSDGCCTCSDEVDYIHNLAITPSEDDACVDGLGRSLIRKSSDTIETTIQCE